MLLRIISTATVSLLKQELVVSTAPLQTCAGLQGEIEASIHGLRQMYEDEATEGILLIDAKNAFNALNRKAALYNIEQTALDLSRLRKTSTVVRWSYFSRTLMKSSTHAREQLREAQSRWDFMQPA